METCCLSFTPNVTTPEERLLEFRGICSHSTSFSNRLEIRICSGRCRFNEEFALKYVESGRCEIRSNGHKPESAEEWPLVSELFRHPLCLSLQQVSQIELRRSLEWKCWNSALKRCRFYFTTLRSQECSPTTCLYKAKIFGFYITKGRATTSGVRMHEIKILYFHGYLQF